LKKYAPEDDSVKGYCANLTYLRQQIHADSAIHRKRSRSRNHQRESHGDQENWKLNAFERRGVLNKNQDAPHDRDDGQGGQASEEAEKERQTHSKLSNKKKGSQNVWEAIVVRTRPKGDRVTPARSTEPAERLLHAVEEKYSSKRYPQKERREAGRSGEKGVDGIT
jgi:hypothetical protein